jgi:uncharacterized protein (TIGR03435 family)
LELLIEIAFGVPDTQISGAPSWLGSERYDVNAKAVDGVSLTYDQLKPRLQQLLVQRFKLATHRETKIFDGYALIVAKGGPKLQPTKGSTAQGIIYPSGLRIPNATMEGLASWLTGPTGRHVIDKIGIEGNYDIQLEYAPLGSDDTFLPSIFTAVQKQLGLKLEHQKVPVEILVIDHVERTHDRKLAGGRRRACR